jgi:diguanylate cyclase (GGDEF)-like protein
VLVLAGPRLPRRALAPLGPIGAARRLRAESNAWCWRRRCSLPVAGLWTTFFFGRRGAVSIVACIGVAHAITLLLLPGASSYPGRWVDVMVSVSAVSVVILALVHRNDMLLTQLADEARTDTLTGLVNRRGFDERASLELAHARRDGRSIAVVALDIDFVKRINDEWGHEVGDQVLARIGELLTNQTRDIDVAARFVGEEFVVLLPGCTTSDAEAFSERMRHALASDGSTGLPTVRVSSGIFAEVAPNGVEAMLRGADSALYGAKRAGRDRVVIADRQGDPRAHVLS